MKNKNLKICIIGIYFGEIPNYFESWLLSCKYNPTIDFLIFLDHEINDIPDNVRVIYTNLKEIKALFSEKLNMTISMDNPYKLCDYKPAYGLMFSDYLKDYDYWGHCDFDLMWGDLRKFICEKNLGGYDKFLPLGHLSLYKNTYENNCMFMEVCEDQPSYREIFSFTKNYVFDEIGIVKRYYNKNKSFFDEIVFVDINDKLKRYTHVTNVKYYPSIYQKFKEQEKIINHKNQLFLWDKGKVYCFYKEGKIIKEKEFMYIHIQKRDLKIDISSNKLYLAQNCIAPFKHDYVTKKDIKKLNAYNWYTESLEKIVNFLKHCWSYFKRRVIKIEQSNIVIKK